MTTKTSTSIASVVDGQRATIVGNIENIGMPMSKEGKERIEFDIRDASGSIRCVGFGDTVGIFKDVLVNNKTYRVIAPVRANRDILELRIWPDTRIEAVTQQNFDIPVVTIDKLSSGRHIVHAVVTEIENIKETLSNGSIQRRAMLHDRTGSITVFFSGDIADDPLLKDGAVLKIDGTKKTMFFASIVEPSEESIVTDLSDFVNSEQGIKRQRTVLSNIADLRSAEKGTSSPFTAVVMSRSLLTTPARNGGIKLEMTVVDQSGFSVDLTLYGNSGDDFCDISVGTVLYFVGKVSSYNTVSLSSNKYEVLDGHDLTTWWTEHANDMFEELSIDPTQR